MKTRTFHIIDTCILLPFIALALALSPLSANAQCSVNGWLDSDCDGIPDWWTQLYFGHSTGQAWDNSRANDDADGDSVYNIVEFSHGTDPTNSDTDGDGLPDYYEISIWPAADELNPDTDGDQMPDGWEYFHTGDSSSTRASADEDPDNDGWTNIQEFILGTDPMDANSHPTGSTNWSFSNVAGEWVAGEPHLTWESSFVTPSYIAIWRRINGGDWEKLSAAGGDTSWTDTSGFTSCCSGGNAEYKISAWYIVYLNNHAWDVYLGEAPNDPITLSW